MEVDEAALRGVLLLLYGGCEADDRLAVAHATSCDCVALALQGSRGLFLGLTKQLAAKDNRRIRGHRHRQAVVTHVVFVFGLHVERAAREGVHAVAPPPATDHGRDQRPVSRLQSRRQNVANDFRLGEVLDCQHLRAEEVGLGQGGLEAGDFFASLYESHEHILLLHSRLAGDCRLSGAWRQANPQLFP